MRPGKLLLAVLLALSVSPGQAQVLSPPEILDTGMRTLQERHLADLKAVGVAVTAHPFPFHFYFSRKLDIPEDVQKGSDQRSIQFARYRDLTVVKITGNYYGAYSDERMKKEERLRRTFQDVLLPILREAVPRLGNEPELQAFALEVSHHVRQKVLGVSAERPENVVLIAPRAVAARMVAAQTAIEQKAAAEGAELYVNGQPATLWPGEKPVLAEAGQPKPETKPANTPAPTYNAVRLPGPLQVAPIYPAAAPAPAAIDAAPAQARTPDALAAMQASYQPALDRIVKELDKEAHFVSYAPPAFVEFRKSLYLQLSITTTLPENESGSQYRLAALAFDQHVAHLIRPVLAYFKDRVNFDGIDFSTSERIGEKSS